MTLEEQLIMHEGLRLKPYRCPTGALTIGVGRNLDAVGLSWEEAMLLLQHDIERISAALAVQIEGWERLEDARRRVLIDMAFNLGVQGLLRFRRLRDAVRSQEWGRAAAEMRASRWASQVKQRAVRLARWMERGVIDVDE